jgi:MerR family transcriptional regulator, light-induced transcriptional regulator
VSGSRSGEGAGWRIGEAAQRLGVSVDTLRTWDRRYGLGPSGRTEGGHRRYLPDEVSQLRQMQQLLFAGESTAAAAAIALGKGASPGGRRGGGGVLALPRTADAAAHGLARAAMALDVPAMQRLIRTTLAERGVIGAWESLLMPILVSLGDRTDRTGTCIEVEHALSECVRAALVSVAETSRQELVADTAVIVGDAPVLLCAPGDEEHTLPLYALDAALAAKGIAVCLLGARVPSGALAAAIRRLNPPVVFLWAHDRHGTDQLTAVPPRTRARTVVGGPGWQPEELPAGIVHPLTLREAVEAIRRLVP